MSSRNALAAQWDKMSKRDRYNLLLKQYTDAWKEYPYMKSRIDETAKEWCMMDFASCAQGVQDKILRGLSTEWAMNEDYRYTWIPTRGAKYGRWSERLHERLYVGDYVHIEAFAQIKENGQIVSIETLFGPEGTFGRILKIRMADDPVDSYALVLLGDGRRAPFYSYALVKADQKRLDWKKWRDTLAQLHRDDLDFLRRL